MTKLYKRLTAEEREIISQLLAQGKTDAVIAKELHRSLSTISRETHVSRENHTKFSKRNVKQKLEHHNGTPVVN